MIITHVNDKELEDEIRSLNPYESQNAQSWLQEADGLLERGRTFARGIDEQQRRRALGTNSEAFQRRKTGRGEPEEDVDNINDEVWIPPIEALIDDAQTNIRRLEDAFSAFGMVSGGIAGGGFGAWVGGTFGSLPGAVVGGVIGAALGMLAGKYLGKVLAALVIYIVDKIQEIRMWIAKGQGCQDYKIHVKMA